jgi:predicted MPP superfamily phosphohydrolase
VLLHDPGQFQFVPDGLGDLVLSGHTHGGQVGLVDLGIPVTMVSIFTSIPDFGPWAKGRNRLYVNRGLGHYGYPLRIGVSAEEPLIRLHMA